MTIAAATSGISKDFTISFSTVIEIQQEAIRGAPR
jgi:hypothetical protein